MRTQVTAVALVGNELLLASVMPPFALATIAVSKYFVPYCRIVPNTPNLMFARAHVIGYVLLGISVECRLYV